MGILMRIELTLRDAPADAGNLRTYDPELDDIRSILGDVCERVPEGGGTFVISGFGQDPWPVDVRTELTVLLEQLPDALDALQSHAPFELDFYEQGLQRKITFAPLGTDYLASCQSYGNWQPAAVVERIDSASLFLTLMAVQREFMRFLRQSFPGLARHPWVQEWIRDES
jgi:hypothetical protein